MISSSGPAFKRAPSSMALGDFIDLDAVAAKKLKGDGQDNTALSERSILAMGNNGQDSGALFTPVGNLDARASTECESVVTNVAQHNDSDSHSPRLALVELDSPEVDPVDKLEFLRGMRQRFMLYESIRGEVDILLGRNPGMTRTCSSNLTANCSVNKSVDSPVTDAVQHIKARHGVKATDDDKSEVDSLDCDTLPLDG